MAAWPRGARALLVGVDGQEGGERALATAARLAQQFGLHVVVGHVQPMSSPIGTGGYAQDLRDDLEMTVLTQASAVLDPAGLQWILAIASGAPAAGLHDLAQRYDVDVVVIGTHGAGAGPALRRLVNGSVSSWLVHHGRRPVLVVPETTTAPAT
jgi:nucleotide-binding universal stress UspA family protein